MNELQFQARLRAGIGGPGLWKSRSRTIAETSEDILEVGRRISHHSDSVDKDPNLRAVQAVGVLLRMAGELAAAAGRMLSGSEHYAGAAILRQIVEIEYLTWTFKEGVRRPTDWLKSTHEQRMREFAPVQLRKTSKGRFLDKDYRDHCEQGGHPVPRGAPLLGGRNAPAAQLLLADLIVHCWRTWDNVFQWSSGFPEASATVGAYSSRISRRLHKWGERDPLYQLMVEVRPETVPPQS